MTLDEKLEALRFASFGIGYADPRKAYSTGYLSWSDISQYPFDGGMPIATLDGVTKSEDQYDQSSTVDRSNFRSLVRDYGQAFISVSYANVDVLAVFPHSVSDDLVNLVVGLSVEYPVYDESDMSELEWDEIHDAFDAYLWSDTWSDLSTEAQDIAGLFSSTNEIRDAFYSAMSASDYFPEHSGLDIHWDDAEVARLMNAALFGLAATLTPTDASQMTITGA